MSFYTCFDWFTKLRLFVNVRNMKINVVPKASRAVVIGWFSLNEATSGLFRFISDYLPYLKNKYILIDRNYLFGSFEIISIRLYTPLRNPVRGLHGTGTCFIQKIYAPSSSLLQGKHLPFTPSPLRLNIFRLFAILSLIQLYRYTPEIFLFSTATFKYKYRAPLRRIGQEYSAKVAFSNFQSLKRIQSLPVRSKLI